MLVRGTVGTVGTVRTLRTVGTVRGSVLKCSLVEQLEEHFLINKNKVLC
jgi:hypothetical protein